MWSPRWSTDPSRSVDGNGVLPRKTRIGLVAGGLGAYWPQLKAVADLLHLDLQVVGPL